MALRKLWVIDLISEKVAFSKCFPTVERRARIVHGETYHPLPCDREFVDLVMKSVGLADIDNEFVLSRDRCDKFEEKPVFEVGHLWPVIVIESRNCLLCCLPLVEVKCQPRPLLINCPGVAMGYSTLQALATFTSTSSFLAQTKPTDKFIALQQFVTSSMPFGTPYVLSSESLDAIHRSSAAAAATLSTVPSQQLKTPAWKPACAAAAKNKSSLTFTVCELLRSSLYDHEGCEARDVCEVYGSIRCRAELEGLMPSLSVSVASEHILDHLLVDPCVQQSDSDPVPDELQTSMGTGKFDRKLRFSPPLGVFTLCHYTCSSVRVPPIRAFYQMRIDGGKSQANVLVQLKLADGVKNSFEYLDVHLPFLHKGKLLSKELTLSQGVAHISSDGTSLVWSLGHSFPRKTLEATLNGFVKFSSTATGSTRPATSNLSDSFSIGLNSYAKINFKIMDFTISGCNIDSKSISMLPHSRIKLHISRELVATDYKVWNSHGKPFLALGNTKET